ncbi:MAG: hypothetical protein K6E16_00670 [Lachnospiraceae bacterium]|nr:hypothetical protein [Lachnospiraceae bacterium]
MEIYAVLGVVVLLLLIFYVSGKITEHRRKEYLIHALKDAFGKLPEEDYLASDLERIRKYHEKRKEHADKECFVIDEITWNDLEMDEIFALFNATQSSPGEEYLYHILHCMRLNEEENPVSRLSDHFLSNDQQRFQIQMILHKVGKIKQFSITDILNYANDLPQEKNLKHYLVDLGILLSAGLIFLNAAVGVLLLVVFLAISVISYFHRKAEISPYFTTFFYVIRLLKAAEEILKMEEAAFEAENEDLQKIVKSCRGFQRSAFFLATGVQFSQNILDILMEYIRILFHLDIIKFNSMLRFLQEHEEDVEQLREIIGRFDASIGVANARTAMELAIPEFTSVKTISVENAFHPLVRKPVPNSIAASSGILITGSNASGKSTFIKSIALCALLSQTIHVVPAQSYKACRVRLVTSMALKDEITHGESYFVVEIKSLKRIVDLAEEEGQPVLCFVDEVLRGTNTVERIAASSRILKSLNRKNAICFAATHDIELTHILDNEFTNYHFEEEVVNGDVTFQYRIKDGRSHTQNAIMLLSMIGFDKETIEDAKEAAAHFTQTSQWSKI